MQSNIGAGLKELAEQEFLGLCSMGNGRYLMFGKGDRRNIYDSQKKMIISDYKLRPYSEQACFEIKFPKIYKKDYSGIARRWF